MPFPVVPLEIDGLHWRGKAGLEKHLRDALEVGLALRCRRRGELSDSGEDGLPQLVKARFFRGFALKCVGCLERMIFGEDDLSGVGADVIFPQDAFRCGGEGIAQPEEPLFEKTETFHAEDLDTRLGPQIGESGAPLETPHQQEDRHPENDRRHRSGDEDVEG